jgi:hypothetical protein
MLCDVAIMYSQRVHACMYKRACSDKRALNWHMLVVFYDPDNMGIITNVKRLCDFQTIISLVETFYIINLPLPS